MAKVAFEAVKDPHIRLAKQFAVDVRDGPAQISYYRTASQAMDSNNQVFTITPAPNQGLSRYASLRMAGTTTITSASAAKLDATNFAAALRAWPIMNCLENVTVSINGVSVVTSNMRQIRKAWARISNPAESQNGIQSSSDTAFDTMSRYIDQPVSNNGSVFNGNVTRGDGVFPARTANITSVEYTADKIAVVKWEVTEPLTAAPFIAAADNQTALYGLSGNVTIQMTLSDVGKANILSVFSDAAITSVVKIEALELQYQLYTPNESAIERLPPQWYHMPAFDLRTSAPAATAFGADGTVVQQTLQTNSYILNQVPRLLVIWIEDKDILNKADGSTATQADATYPISAIQIDFLNKQGILVGMSQQQLFQHSVTAGLRATYQEFAGLAVQAGYGSATADLAKPKSVLAYGSGTCVVIDCASLDLAEDVVPGTNVPCTIRVQATLAMSKNIRGASAAVAVDQTAGSVVLQVLAVSPAFLQLHANAAMYVQGGLTPADAASARKAPATRVAAFEDMAYNGTLAGGSFFSDFAKGLNIAANLAAPIAKAVGLGGLLTHAGGATLTQKGAMTLRERLARQ